MNENINNSNFVSFARLSSKNNAKKISENNSGAVVFAKGGTGEDGEIWVGGIRYGSSTSNNSGGETVFTVTPTVTVGNVKKSVKYESVTASSLLQTMLVQEAKAEYVPAKLKITNSTVNKFVGETLPSKDDYSVTAETPKIVSDETTTAAGNATSELVFPTGKDANTVINDRTDIVSTIKMTWAKGSAAVKNNLGNAITTNNDIPVYKKGTDTQITKSEIIEELSGVGYVVKGSNEDNTNNESKFKTTSVTASFWRRFKYFSSSDNSNVTEIPLLNAEIESNDAGADDNINATNIGTVAGIVPDDAITLTESEKYYYLLLPNDHFTTGSYGIQIYNVNAKSYEPSSALSKVLVDDAEVTYGHYTLYKIEDKRSELKFKIVKN